MSSYSPLPSPKNPWKNQIQNKSNPLSTPTCSSPPLERRRETTHQIWFPSPETFATWVWSESTLGLLGFALLLLSSTGVVARNHTSNPISIAWSFHRPGLVRIGPWVAGFCIIAFLSSSLFISVFWSLVVVLCMIEVLLISALLNWAHRAQFLYDIIDIHERKPSPVDSIFMNKNQVY